MKRLVVLASGSGTNLQALIDAITCGELEAEIAAVISERPDAGALGRAVAAGIPALTLSLADRRDPAIRAAYDRDLASVVDSMRPDLVVLAGWMLICGTAFLERFPGRIVNVHPALLPDGEASEVTTSRGRLPALRGARAVAEALRRELPLTGATVHYVTSAVDAGPLIAHEEVPILPGDDETRLHERIKRAEHRLLPRAVSLALAASNEEE